MSEQGEKLTVPGPQGEHGETGKQGQRGKQGEQGAAGLPPSVRLALVFMFALNLLLIGVAFIWISHVVNANAQQRCASLEQDVKIPVPQPVAGNPSREFDAQTEAIDRQRLRNLHCSGSGQ